MYYDEIKNKKEKEILEEIKKNKKKYKKFEDRENSIIYNRNYGIYFVRILSRTNNRKWR